MKIWPTIILIAALVSAKKHNPQTDKREYMIPIIALAISIVGDVFGDFKSSMNGDIGFICQIACFTVAHFLYIGSFNRHAAHDPEVEEHKHVVARRTLLRALLIFYLVFFGNMIMSTQDGAMRIAVGCYMSIIASMALVSTMQHRKNASLYIIGAYIFVISDSLIAYSAFIGTFVGRDFLVMWTYYIAQLFINISLVRNAGE